jgi:hypothetical protein
MRIRIRSFFEWTGKAEMGKCNKTRRRGKKKTLTKAPEVYTPAVRTVVLFIHPGLEKRKRRWLEESIFCFFFFFLGFFFFFPFGFGALVFDSLPSRSFSDIVFWEERIARLCTVYECRRYGVSIYLY